MVPYYGSEYLQKDIDFIKPEGLISGQKIASIQEGPCLLQDVHYMIYKGTNIVSEHTLTSPE